MEIKNILKTGYHVIVVTVTLIEAFELGKNLIGKCNKTCYALEGNKEINGGFWETF